MPRFHCIRPCTLVAGVVLAVAISGAAHAADGHDGHGAHQGHASASQPADSVGDPYLLDFDPVSTEPLVDGEHQVIIHHEGRELRFNSQANADAFKAQPDRYLPRVDARIIAQQLPYYPVDTCVVSGEKLDEMGEPINFVYRNRLIRFCCKMCKGEFLKEPGAYIEKLDAAAIAAQADGYLMGTCMISGEELGGMGDPIQRVYGNRLVEFCCPHCEKTFLSNPSHYIGVLDEAAEQHGGHGEAHGGTSVQGNSSGGHSDHKH